MCKNEEDGVLTMNQTNTGSLMVSLVQDLMREQSYR